MHSSIQFSSDYAPLLDSLNEPLYAGSRRDARRFVNAQTELSFEEGFQIQYKGFESEANIQPLLTEFRTFLKEVMEVAECPQGLPIHLERSDNEGRHPDCEDHLLDISREKATLAASSLQGLRRALYRFQDEMLIRSAPIVPLGRQEYHSDLRVRISRNPIAPYRWLSGWELEDERDYYPEAYLRRIAHAGVNGLWIPVLFRNLIASNEIPEMGPPEHRLGKLKALVSRAARYGIRIYLFCIEPRALPEGHPVLTLYPELIGARRSLCISQPRVQTYLRTACQTLSQEVPELGGLINIFCGERYSNCWANAEHVQSCESCRKRSQAEIHSLVLNCMVEGLKEGSPSPDLLAWTYLMASSTESLPIEPMLRVVEKTDPRVIWLGNYEHGGSKKACGREVPVHEYSLSCVAPSKNFKDLAEAVNGGRRTIYAKLQMGTSYELSSVPWITAPPIVAEKVTDSISLGSRGALLGWIVGGLPGPMLKAAGEAAFSNSAETALHRTAAVVWGEQWTPAVLKAWDHFSNAWRQYPFHNALLYWGPLTRAPAYPLYLEKESRLAKPYNWGLDRERGRQPFENHPERWLGDYTTQEIIDSLRSMASRWEEGLTHLRTAVNTLPHTPEREREWRVAEATRHQLLSAANIYEFNTLRLLLIEGDLSVLGRMSSIAQEELENTRAMLPHLHREPWIGFQSEIYGYSYSAKMLEEKCDHLCHTFARLCRWQERGVEWEVLEAERAEIEFKRPDDTPDLFGD